jgi:hypothetical protein
MEEGVIDPNQEIEGINRIIYIFCCIGLFIIISGTVALIVINYLFEQKIWI